MEREQQLFIAPTQPLDSDERYTPKWVFDHMNLVFDLDPCSPVFGGDCVPARHKLTVNDDGLSHEWRGTVWINPPFSNAGSFAYRFMKHGDGVWLGPVSNSRWMIDLLDVADLVWLCADFAFTHPTHAGRRSSMPLAFCAIGKRGTDGLRRLADSRVHRGTLMQRCR